MNTKLPLAILLVALTGCAGVLDKMSAKPVERSADKQCVRYELEFVQPHLGNDRWGPVEFGNLVYTDGPGSYRYYGQYVACPPASAADASLVQLWRDWRKIRMADRTTYWDYNETTASADIAPVALVPRTSRSVSDDGVLYKVQVYDAFFAGCDYWASTNRDYQCTK